MIDFDEINEALSYIDPSDLEYQEWCNVGMALKAMGCEPDVFDEWSARDMDRYHPGEAEEKFKSFNASGITKNTLFKIAYDRGMPKKSKETIRALPMDAVIDYSVIDKTWIEREDIKEPSDYNWQPLNDFKRYLEALFNPKDHVGLVIPPITQEADRDGKYKPISSGVYRLTAGELIAKIDKAQATGKGINTVIGDYHPEAGAWIRFNPLDGQGVKNANVTSFKYALVESDKMELGMQLAILKQLELPTAALVYSGKKSIHAIVHIDANDLEEYKKRVEYLYKICKKNGLDIDIQNKNPSRLSRLPGVIRGDHKQFLIDTNIGKSSWAEWEEYIDQVTDDLPDPESLAVDWDNMPDLAQPLIDGILRQGHKMLIAGPSKAGKSFALIELSIAIAEGIDWLGEFKCTKGRVLYINLELDRASCLHRFQDVYKAMGINRPNLQNIDIWNLRGHAVPMTKLTPKLIRRAEKKGYLAIIIDPIYKVITGDENSAEQMSKFCNQFDTVATSLGCAVIYCHHHSKGAQGGKKAMDRASGSGVFARDPDAMIDMVQLPIDEEVYPRIESDYTVRYFRSKIEEVNPFFFDDKEDTHDLRTMRRYGWEVLRKQYNDNQIDGFAEEAKEQAESLTAWRLSFTLREFPTIPPTDIYFGYPTHFSDETGVLAELTPDEELAPWQKGTKQNASDKAKKKRERKKANSLEIAFSALELEGGEITYQRLADKMGKNNRTIRRYIASSPLYTVIEDPNKHEPAIIKRKENNA